MTHTVAVIGASGYTGAELLRLLPGHAGFDVRIVTAATQAGRDVRAVYPNLTTYGGLAYRTLDDAWEDVAACDVVFCGLPHGEAMNVLPDLSNDLVVDLGGDFRLDDASDYEAWYGIAHAAPDVLGDWTYGLTELFRDDVAEADRIACPGCYPTAVSLAVAPIADAGLIEGPVVADAMSGTSGAGRAAKPNLHFAHVDEDVRAYKLGTHQHTPEMEMAVSTYADTDVTVSFTAHLVPMVRGIHATCSAALTPGTSARDLLDALRDVYDAEPFVRVTDETPGTKQVMGSNNAIVSAAIDARAGRAILTGVIDNLVKGASGQAIQNANVVLGLGETTGLPTEGLYP